MREKISKKLIDEEVTLALNEEGIMKLPPSKDEFVEVVIRILRNLGVEID